MRTIQKVLLVAVVFAIPASAFALEGSGPRASVTGTIQELRITDAQKFNEMGGEAVIKSTNGQLVTVLFEKESKIITEGRLSRKNFVPSDLRTTMSVRVSGRRVDSKTLIVTLLTIINAELNPILSGNGTLQSVNGNAVTLVMSNGEMKTFTLTNETEVYISYTIWGPSGLSLLGKSVQFTLNQTDLSQLRILRILGTVDPVRTQKPTSIELGRRSAN